MRACLRACALASHFSCLLLDQASACGAPARKQTLEAGVIQHSACLVIVDSVAALARADFGGAASELGGGGGSIMERQEMLGSVAGRLKQLAEAFRIPVVVTNQCHSSHPSTRHQ
eukprot:147003-Chlamydomonas_euryale.AAC.2